MVSEPTKLAKPLKAIDRLLARASDDPINLVEAERALRDFALSASATTHVELENCATTLVQLLELIACEPHDSDCVDEHALLTFVEEALVVLQASATGDLDDTQELIRTQEEALHRWGDYLDLANQLDHRAQPAVWEDQSGTSTLSETDLTDPSQEDVNRILISLAAGESSVGDSHGKTDSPRQLPKPPQLPTGLEIDEELLAAYLDDASHCLGEIERILVEGDSCPDQNGLQQMCRELHTMKGASASIGLNDLASYLHAIEEHLQAVDHDQLDGELLLRSVDTMRAHVGSLSKSGGTAVPIAATDGELPTACPAIFDAAVDREDESLRVRTSRLDRLMDLLAELVLVRNRRDSQLKGFEQLHGELIRCVTRLRKLSDGYSAERIPSASTNRQLETPSFRVESDQLEHHDALPNEPTAAALAELANDLSTVARELRDALQPLTADNLHISRFTRQFRQELIDVRRAPVSALFRRLQRAAHDAARSENKQLQIILIGEQCGLDRSIQERLFEPLLHIVRNAVSHGIESESQRVVAGKDPAGSVTLQARAGVNSMVIEVRDDGNGLDYEAIRRRGMEMGLLSPDRPATRKELNQLIFHRGFSTRQSTTEVSGRGVGMDIVADTLERLQSRIEVDSSPGQGTTARLTVLLRSVIEHTMLFRVGGQLFALPMQYVHAANAQKSVSSSPDESSPAADMPRVRLRDLLSLSQAGAREFEPSLVVGNVGFHCGSAADGELQSAQPVELLVDEICGPEEAVVRSLPPLISAHCLFSGVTIAGRGDIVLLIDCKQLLAVCRHHDSETAHARPAKTVNSAAPSHRPSLLVVDDSLSARRHLCRLLSNHGCAITEAGNGIEALDMLHEREFQLVFTDVDMPQLGGFELLSEIRSRPRTRSLRVVMVTSRNEPEVQSRAFDFGADGFLTKPVTQQGIAAEIAKFRECVDSET